MSKTLRESVKGDDTKAEVWLRLRQPSPRPASVMSVLDRLINMPVAAMACVIAQQERHDNIDPEDGLPRRYTPCNDKTVHDKMDCHVASLHAMTT
jgi:hypothetical protein